MKHLAIFVIALALISGIGFAKVTIGVSPSVVNLDFTKNSTKVVNFMFWNRGNEDLCLTILGSKDVKTNITKPIEIVVPPSMPFINNVNFPVKFYDSVPNGTYYFDVAGKPCSLKDTNVNYVMSVRLNVTSYLTGRKSNSTNNIIRYIIGFFIVLAVFLYVVIKYKRHKRQ